MSLIPVFICYGCRVLRKLAVPRESALQMWRFRRQKCKACAKPMDLRFYPMCRHVYDDIKDVLLNEYRKAGVDFVYVPAVERKMFKMVMSNKAQAEDCVCRNCRILWWGNGQEKKDQSLS